MTLILMPDEVKPIKHPGRRMSEDEMAARCLCDLKDPDARFPTHCSVCHERGVAENPLRLEPVSRDMKDLVKSYLYRAICARCTYRSP